MKILHKNLRKGEIKVMVDELDDLWTLSQVIDQKDIVSGMTFRKIKTGGNEQDTSSARIKVFLDLNVEKVEFHESSTVLRVSGKIIEGQDDIPAGSYHTISVEEGSVITISKPRWLKYQLDRIDESTQKKGPGIIICVFDREEAYFAKLKTSGYEILLHLEGSVQKKYADQKSANFYEEIIKALEEYDKRYSPTNIILASPSFWKEYLMNELKNDDLKKKIVQATCSAVGESAIAEVLKRGELKKVLEQDRVSKESNLVEELFVEISKENLAAYGMKEVRGAIEAGAVAKLLVCDSLIIKLRASGKYNELEWLMKKTEENSGEIHLISSTHGQGKRLDGLGGIGAILRYKMNYG